MVKELNSGVIYDWEFFKKPYLITISKEKKYRVRAELHSQVMIDGKSFFKMELCWNSLQRSPLHKSKQLKSFLCWSLTKIFFALCLTVCTPRVSTAYDLHSPPVRIAPGVVHPTHFSILTFQCYPHVLACCSFHAIQTL